MTYTLTDLEQMDTRTLAATALEVVCEAGPRTAWSAAELPWQAMGEVVEALKRHSCSVQMIAGYVPLPAVEIVPPNGEPVHQVATDLPAALMRAAVLAIQSERG